MIIELQKRLRNYEAFFVKFYTEEILTTTSLSLPPTLLL